jgi:mono/diheme cytochrome c family protein
MKKINLFVIALVFGFGLIFAGSALADGASVFKSKCVMCHGGEAQGTMMGPKLAGSDVIKGEAANIKTILSSGVSGKAKKYPNFAMDMPKFAFSDAELDSIVSYLKSL